MPSSYSLHSDMSLELKQLDPATIEVIYRMAIRCLPERECEEVGRDYNDEEQGIIQGWNMCRDLMGAGLVNMFGDPNDYGEYNQIAKAVFDCLPHFEQLAEGEDYPHGERDFIQGRNSMLEEVRACLFQLFCDPSYVRVPFTPTPNP